MADKPSKGGWDAARAASGYVVSHPESRKGKSAKKAKATKKKGSEARRRSREGEQRTAESTVYEPSESNTVSGYASERRPPEGNKRLLPTEEDSKEFARWLREYNAKKKKKKRK